MGKRVRAVRADRGWTLKDLADRTGLDFGYLGHLERGEQRWNLEVLEAVARALEVDLADLLPPALQRGRRLPQGEFRGSNAAGPIELRPLPVISKVAAGDPKEYTDGEYPPGFADRFEPCPIDLDDPHVFALEIEGDSMEPRFPRGTVVICSPRKELRNGRPAVVKVKNEATTCKILWRRKDRIILQSLNPKYPPQTIFVKDLRWAYAVVKSIRNER